MKSLWLLSAVAALYPAVDDHDGGSEARLQLVLPVAFVRLPGAVNDVEHAGLGRLRVGVEPGGGGEVEPGVRHEVRVVEQQPALAEHGLAELPVVEVVAQLLGAAPVVLPPLARPVRAARPLLGQAVRLDAVVVILAA